VEEMRAGLSAPEYDRWLSFAAERGLPHRKGLSLLAHLLAAFLNVHSRKGTPPAKASDFLGE
jgi:hypothetical protein